MSAHKIATYRLQLQPDFGFDQVCSLVEYLKKLGISHVYTSPYLQAASGSTHGYDVVDPTRVNAELGGEAAHARMCKAIQDTGLAHMIDIVPNHMAITDQQNPWWWDVLENGPSSLYASYFDVDWDNSEARWENKILLPVLGDHYGRVLEAGELSLEHDKAHFSLCYFEHRFPVDPSSLSALLLAASQKAQSDTLGFLAQSYQRMPRPASTTEYKSIEQRHRDKAVLHVLLSRVCEDEPALAAAIDEQVDHINDNVDALDAFIDNQSYRLAFWKTASRDLGYRRFFDIADLAGLRAEDPKVFNDTHALPIAWVRKGWVQGLRVDHSDGLRDPNHYFMRLREHCPDTWIVTEKILEPGEHFRKNWPIDGTTGYDFLGICTRLLTYPKGENPLKQFSEEFTGEAPDLTSVITNAKKQVLSELLQSELKRLTTLFVNICEGKRRQRDFSRPDLYEAVAAVAENFAVYRTYVSRADSDLDPEDFNYIHAAITLAKEQHSDFDPELLDFLEGILCMRERGQLECELALRFQQLTGPVMAKGVEDTTFYRYNVLLAHNDVGNSPSHFCASLEDFHRFAEDIQAERPETLLTLTTHDTKRSEDTRARLLTLAEIPSKWRLFVLSLHENIRLRCPVVIPANVEYFIYQTLVAAWPIDQERINLYMKKALREAKQHTTWTQPNESFEADVNRFIETIYSDTEFQGELTNFVRDIEPAGFYNSLAQTLLKLTAPGVPDIYQGCELWDFSLVDPDNRRAVDYEKRIRLLNELGSLSIENIMARLAEGLPKMWLVYKTLQVRSQLASCYSSEGVYEPLYAQGEHKSHVIAYCRGERCITVVSRFNLSRPEGWQDTFLDLPPGRWRNVFTDDYCDGGHVMLSQLTENFPVALLVKESL